MNSLSYEYKLFLTLFTIHCFINMQNTFGILSFFCRMTTSIQLYTGSFSADVKKVLKESLKLKATLKV